MDVPSSCYALLALTELSLASEARPLSRVEIGRRHSLPSARLSRVLSRLSRAGLVRSAPGRGGGYYLAARPGDISIAAVVAAVADAADDAMPLPACSGHDGCVRGGGCWLAPFWRDLGRRVNDVLESVTLADVSAGPAQGDGADAAARRVTLRDVTERSERERRLTAINQLEVSGILAGKLAQQFCDLLTGVVGSVSLARAQAGSATEVGHTLEWAETAALVADVLLQQMVAQTGEHPDSRGPVPLQRILTDALRLVTHGTAVRSSLRVDPDLHPVSGDAALLRQAIQGLLLNAVEAMPDGGALSVAAANATVAAGAEAAVEPGDYVRLTIEDSGSGLPEATKDMLFVPYHSTKPGRSGLGLATAAAVTRQHGGTVSLCPAAHAGTIAEVLLPADAAARPESAEPRGANGERRILLVEDESIVVTVLTRMLDTLGYRSDAVTSLAEVETRLTAALWESRPYETVVVDTGLAGRPALTNAMARLRQLDPQARLIATSPYVDAPGISDLAPLGFATVLRKPFTFDDLKQALRAVARAGRQSG